jgi:hypothetical protein
MATWIFSRRHSSCLGLAVVSNAVSLIAWIQLPVFHFMFCSSIGSTAYWPNIMPNGEYPVLHLTVILLAQTNDGRWLIHISCGLSMQAVSLDNAAAIRLCPHLSTPFAAA